LRDEPHREQPDDTLATAPHMRGPAFVFAGASALRVSIRCMLSLLAADVPVRVVSLPDTGPSWTDVAGVAVSTVGVLVTVAAV
jgi:hypothetical protein